MFLAAGAGIAGVLWYEAYKLLRHRQAITGRPRSGAVASAAAAPARQAIEISGCTT